MYGRRTLTGLLASRGVKAGERRVGESLRYVSPVYCQARTNSVARMTNPASYRAIYFGHKLHIDQNEKNVMFGVTHICAVDGFSRKIVAFSTMPIKNNYLIYDTVYRYFITCNNYTALQHSTHNNLSSKHFHPYQWYSSYYCSSICIKYPYAIFFEVSLLSM